MNEQARNVIGKVALGNQRLSQRLWTLTQALIDQPEASIPLACGSWAATTAAYRFLDNEAVDWRKIVAGIAAATLERCRGQRRVLAVQDTTSVDFTTHAATTELGPLEHPAHRGVFVHSTLAVSEEGVPLGLLDQQQWTRTSSGEPEDRHRVPTEGKESAKWLQGLLAAEQRIEPETQIVTVADREADVFDLFALAAALQGDWLVRARHDRALAADERHLLAAAQSAPLCGTIEVSVPARADQSPRCATLEVRSTRVTLAAPTKWQAVQERWWDDHPEAERLAPTPRTPLEVGVIWIDEPAAPAGATRVRWVLVTSLSVATLEDVLQCVRFYTFRWLIERFHYTLKSGCHVEHLQLQSGPRLERALAVCSAVASWLLFLTYQARVQPTAPASTVLEPQAWQVLCATVHPGQPLPDQPPTLQEAVFLIARLGGFLGRKSDGHPGVKTLWRGFKRLHDLMLGWQLLSQLQPTHPNLTVTCV